MRLDMRLNMKLGTCPKWGCADRLNRDIVMTE